MLQIERAETEHMTLYGGETLHLAPLRAVYAGEGLPVNVAIGFGTGHDALAQLPVLERFYAERGQPARLVVYSHAHPDVLQALGARGYRQVRSLNVYHHPLTSLPPLRAQPVRLASPQAFLATVIAGFGPGSEPIMQRTALRAHTQLYVCELDGQPVAAGALSVLGGVGLLYSAATRPEARGRGAQTALLVTRLHAARAAGARSAAVLTAPGSASERNILRAGFQLVGERWSLEREA
ncbi:GNAT family N-acetyltransferase [Deinococcus sonorensis]|uniref:GNAT family N-acetyltransferase n=2 Tax=Deinococcus sonorensis TaxID=309891 RepID=A0AAU7U8L3_9DEIO